MKEGSSLIDKLTDDLQPVRPVGRGLGLGILLWFCLSTAYVVTTSSLLGPIRPGVLDQLLAHPRFLLETLLGVAAIAILAQAGLRSAVPAALPRHWLLFTLGVTLLWLLNYPLGFFSPSLEPSMLGKRPHCYLETLILALPPALAAIYWQNRLFPLKPLQSAAIAGLAAGMIPALYMQIACMYAPGHILMWHILPGALMALLAVPISLCIKAL
ncbi:NrsF family protein [Pseudohalioglobus lutimaris]|uniref:NrsF family protein n=1 Tax=Pseudohalioglobus lutimaris TaxID=1737061 RepID=UPI00096B8EE4|nr:NrsF family protein [Pseudohalioglobus lutimaris]